MRPLLLALLFGPTLPALAQFPPIDLEWSALRPFGSGEAQIARDPVQGDYRWSVLDDIMLLTNNDELLYPILADGTDLAPASPAGINVGTLDHLVDMELRDGTLYAVVRHQNISGSPQDVYWHLLGAANELTIQSAEEELDDVAHDLLVTDDGAYIAGASRTNTGLQCRLIHTDLQGNLLWDAWWDPIGSDSYGQFTSVALIGDTVVAISHPLMVLFDRATGAPLGQIDYTLGTGTLAPGMARCAIRGQRIYWILANPEGLQYGQYDFSIALNTLTEQLLTGALAHVAVALDDIGNTWFAYNQDGQGRWIKTDAEALAIASGTLYGGISDLRSSGGKLSFTGLFDALQGSSYVFTGTPQP